MLKYWPPLNALRGFESAARLGSFHKAAIELNITQSAVSQQIRSLESYLEQPLFFREGRSVTLTDAGVDFYNSTQDVLQQLAVGVRRLDQYKKSNQLIVNTTPAFARYWLLPRLDLFHQKYPEIDIWLFTTYTVPDMAIETIDIAIRDDISAQKECIYKELYYDKLYPACNPILLNTQKRLTLHGEGIMDWSNWTLQGGESVGQQLNGINFSDPSLLLDAICQGLGIGLVSQLLTLQVKKDKKISSLSKHSIKGNVWSCLIHHEREPGLMTQYFLQWLENELSKCTAEFI
ncbi:LysR family transcriptional regulator [Proteus sp. NMG38-2]|uniref:LysR family transcriptional regulator n=1 Tax=Proteus sp. NMG38-2 TaxID=2883107 RepID=UPI001D0A41A4|nr:LysR family transcriptional regulator [Proteus sp. NMG38-2]UDN37609.1 LysR family transcriptional regulator [Proteus sp. NMG38-2]